MLSDSFDENLISTDVEINSVSSSSITVFDLIKLLHSQK